MTVKTTAQMLQTFGTDLAETELPNDVQCTEELLSAHTDHHSKLKVNGVLWQLNLCNIWFLIQQVFLPSFEILSSQNYWIGEENWIQEVDSVQLWKRTPQVQEW